MIKKIFFALALLALIFNFDSFSQGNGSISGIVVDKSGGVPIESADVSLLNSGDSSVVKGTTTDKEGKFTFTGIPFGKYTVRANFVGYSTMMLKVLL
jgi:uncharacterized surface anchored protein